MHLSKPPGLLVVLGSPNDPTGRLSTMAEERLACARSEHHRRPDFPILLTGGFGEHFNQSPLPHAEHARAHLVSKGVSEDAFTDFALSGNTIEDAALAQPIIDRIDPSRLVVITSDFHVARARYLFDRALPSRSVEYLGAPHACSDATRNQLERHEALALDRLQAS